MIKQELEVIGFSEQQAVLAISHNKLCNHCAAQAACSTSVFAKWLSANNTFVLPKTDQLQVGDKVIVGIDALALLKASFWAYLFPLLSMLCIALLISNYVDHQALIALSALLGLLLAYVVIAKFNLGKYSLVLLDAAVINQLDSIDYSNKIRTE